MKTIKYINKILPFFKKPSDKSYFKNILVVSNTGLGDTILSTPAIKTLKKSFPNIHITFLINKKIYPLFKGFYYVDDFILYSKGFLNQLKIVKKLREKNIDTIFLFHSNGPEDIFFSILSGAQNILKMTDNQNHEFKNIFLNKPNNNLQHNIEKKLDLVRLYNPSTIDTLMEISKKFYNKKLDTLKKNGNKLIGFQIGAQNRYKIWPIENFIELANKILNEQNDIKIVILGVTKEEKKLSRKFLQSIDQKGKILNYCCKTKIKELPFLVNSLNLLITNDTGTMHLAIALKVPTISLFSPTNSKIIGPFQDFYIHKVIQKDGTFVNNKPKKQRGQEAMKLIGVDEVFNLLKKVEF